jgi:endonuclease YncB( thermonuclease family)
MLKRRLKMKLNMKIVGIILVTLVVSFTIQAKMYKWTDVDGNLHVTDSVRKLPSEYQNVYKHNKNHFTSPAGIGFEKDYDGNVMFHDHRSPATRRAMRTEPGDFTGPPGSAVTVEQLAEIKRRYMQWGKEPIPRIDSRRVSKIVSADTFELDDGKKVTFIGIAFPEELKGDTELHAEVVEYQEKLYKGRSVKLLYGPRKTDEKGRTLAYVFVGTDMFVNADLVMNGYAKVKTIPPNTEYRRLFLRLEDFAKRSMLGMWDTGEIEE